MTYEWPKPLLKKLSTEQLTDQNIPSAGATNIKEFPHTNSYPSTFQSLPPFLTIGIIDDPKVRMAQFQIFSFLQCTLHCLPQNNMTSPKMCLHGPGLLSWYFCYGNLRESVKFPLWGHFSIFIYYLCDVIIIYPREWVGLGIGAFLHPAWIEIVKEQIWRGIIGIIFQFNSYNRRIGYLIIMSSQVTIPDDPSVVEPIFREIKANFKTGGTRPAAARKQALKRLLEGYQQMKEDFAESHFKDLGVNSFIYELATHGTTYSEIEDLLKNFQSWMKKETVPTPLALGMASCAILHEPLGVVLVISAWNYPVYTALPPVAAAIAAGNSVILKPSELAPYTSKALVKLFEKYLDPKYYRVIEGKIEVAKAVSKLPVDSICFTGSTMTGRLVAMEAAKNLTPCLLELGGKCPIIVDQTAKIDSAVLRILMGKFLNCGQTCIGVDHVYVHETIYDNFKQELLRKIDEGYGQHKDHQDGHYGKIISQARVNRLEELLKDKHEGTVIYGGTVDKDKLYISPTIVQKPKKDSLMMSEQIFGPIMPLFSYSNLDDVIKQINDRPKPLVVYLFSESSANVKKIQNETYSGAFVVNETLMQMMNHHLPFGGVGMSGSGRYHGKSGFIAFSNPKSICETKAVNPYPMSCRFPPYTEQSKSLMLKLAKIGGVTHGQLLRGVTLVLLVIALAFVLGFVVVPKLKEGN